MISCARAQCCSKRVCISRSIESFKLCVLRTMRRRSLARRPPAACCCASPTTRRRRRAAANKKQKSRAALDSFTSVVKLLAIACKRNELSLAAARRRSRVYADRAPTDGVHSLVDCKSDHVRRRRQRRWRRAFASRVHRRFNRLTRKNES